jgi:hypothetical protein
MATVTSVTPVVVSDHAAQSEAANHKPCARAIVTGLVLAISFWGLVIWGVRALFF